MSGHRNRDRERGGFVFCLVGGGVSCVADEVAVPDSKFKTRNRQGFVVDPARFHYNFRKMRGQSMALGKHCCKIQVSF